jgi:hypothetical protein
MGRLVFLFALVLLALAIYLIVRARRASREEQGYQVQQYDADGLTVIRISRHNLRGRIEAAIPLDDPDYSARVLEEWARATVKAEDWNSTRKALRD